MHILIFAVFMAILFVVSARGLRETDGSDPNH